MKKPVIIIILTALVSMSVAQQMNHLSVDSLRNLNKGSYLTIGLGVGPSGFDYDLKGLVSDGKNDIRLGGHFNIGYSYFFSPNWGIGTGVGMSLYNSFGKYPGDFKMEEYYNLGNYIDDDINSGHPRNYELRLRFSNWEEHQQGYLIEIPLMAQYQFYIGKQKKSGMYFSVGCKLQIPVISKYKVIDGDYNNDKRLNVSGYYNDLNVEYGAPDLPHVGTHGFGSIHNPGELLDWNGDIDMKMSIAGTAELGFLINLSPRVNLSVGGFIDYGFNNIKKNESKLLIESPSSYHPEASNSIGKGITYNGMVNSDRVDKTNLFSYGAKIGLRIKLGKIKEEPYRIDTVYIERIIFDTIVKEVKPVEYIPEYSVSYVVPPVEEVKQRSDTYTANLSFEVAKSDIIRDFMNNNEILKEIDQIITEVQKDTNLTITKLKITGYSSPDGNTPRNLQLSEERAKSFEKYIRENYTINPSILEIDWKGEDWEGLREMLEDSYIQDKSAILNILDTESSPDRRRARIMALSNGSTYRILLNDFFGRLRRNEYTIAYIARPFNINEAKELIKVKPQYLSLNEMFLVANSYPEGSKEFKETFDIAARLYPEDPIAQINVAALDIEDGAYIRAINRLEGIELPEAWNNLGIAYAKQKEFEKAEEYFIKAESAGLKTASENKAELMKQMENFDEK